MVKITKFPYLEREVSPLPLPRPCSPKPFLPSQIYHSPPNLVSSFHRTAHHVPRGHSHLTAFPSLDDIVYGIWTWVPQITCKRFRWEQEEAHPLFILRYSESLFLNSHIWNYNGIQWSTYNSPGWTVYVLYYTDNICIRTWSVSGPELKSNQLVLVT